MNTPKPPPHLRPATAQWFASVVGNYEMEAHHVRLLTLACEAWDRGQQAREIIDRDGITFVDRFGCPKPRPEVAVERDSRIAFARLIREIGIDLAEPAESRPPALRSNRRAG
jgi:phage terminase small subunit